jgi:hypothetical protein
MILLKLIQWNATKVYRGLEVKIHAHLPSATGNGQRLASRSLSLFLQEIYPVSTEYEVGGYQSPSVRFGKQQILLSLSVIEPQFLGRQARRVSITLSIKRERERDIRGAGRWEVCSKI